MEVVDPVDKCKKVVAATPGPRPEVETGADPMMDALLSKSRNSD